MGQARDEAGNIWETDAQGNPVRLIAPAASPQSSIVPPNPMRVAEKQADAARRAAADARAREKADREAREWAATHNPDGSPKPTADTRSNQSGGASVRQKALAQWSSANQLDNTIAELETLYREGPGSTKGVEGAADFLPTEANQRFNTAANAARGIVRNALGLTGGEANTAAEAQLNLGAYIPQAGQYDQTIMDSIGRLKDLRDLARKQAIATLGGVPDENGRVTPLADAAAGHADQQADNEVPGQPNGADTKPPANNNSPPDLPPANAGQTSAASGDYRNVYDARLSSQVDAMINAGASKATIDAVLKRQGFPTIRADDLAAAKAWMRANPGKRYYGANINRREDLNAGQKIAGSPLGAGLAHYANAATAGTVGALSGEKGQGALDAMAALHPGAAMAGEVAGGVTGAMGAEAAVAARAPAALLRYAPRIADTLYGGALGFNTAREGEGGVGALKGAAGGLVGGIVGERAVRGLGSAVRGVSNPATQFLRDRNIPLTVGQAVGGSGRVGAGIKKIEDSLTSIPFVGNVVDARRMEGLRGFNRAAFDTASQQIAGNGVTETGSEGIDQLRALVGRAYDDALSPVRIDVNEPQFLDDMAGVVASGQRIPNVNGARDAAGAALESRIADASDSGFLTGRNFQEAYRGLARTGRERANGDYGHEIGNVMRQGQDALAAALDRQNPGAFEAFRAANSTNRNANVLAEAVNKAKNVEDELFTPAQLNMADTASARRLTGPLASAAGDRPFYDLATAGQSVLPSKLPDSGTTTRALTGLALGGGVGAGGGYLTGDTGTGAGVGLGATLLLAAGGSRPAQRAMVDILATRPELAREIGAQIANRSSVGGWTGAGVLTPLLVTGGQ